MRCRIFDSIRGPQVRAGSSSRYPQEDYARAGFNGTFADGHQFIPDAFIGARSPPLLVLIVSVETRHLMALKDRLLLVEDAIAALQSLPTVSMRPGTAR